MKRKVVLIIALTIMIFSTSTATAIWIDSVDVIPEQPLEIDIITFDIFGTAGFSPSEVEHDEFYQNGTSLRLDLYFNRTVLPAFSDWTHSKVIQPLPPETYTLQIRTFDNDNGTLWDTYTVDLSVVPEPATLVLLCFGASFARQIKRKKSHQP
ncbi:MAG: PEP-CTERM sorting domain-containing protein [Planctomycetota bacterium]